MADIYRLTGDLPEDADPYATPDLKGKSAAESAARLARMLGRDASEGELADWLAVAKHFAACQRAELEDSARMLIERERLAAAAPVIGAGCGRFLARHVAERLGRPYVDFADIIEAAPEAREMAARCAPAVAVALLAGAGKGSLRCRNHALAARPASMLQRRRKPETEVLCVTSSFS